VTDNGATMDLRLRDKLAIVTGSSKGIGHAIATSLAHEGARVVVNGRSEASVATAIDGIRAQVPNAALHPFAGDLARADVAEALIRAFPAPDILVNNLGIFEPVPFEQIPDDDWRRFFEVNVLSGVRLSRLVLAGMKARNWGRIVFISSESAVQIPTEMIHYGMTKTAQLAVSRGLAQLCAGTGVTVNSVLPGPTRSAGVEDFLAALSGGGRPIEEVEQEFLKTARPTSLLRRLATTEEVANMVVYVCSPLSSATNGAALRVDGGVLMSAV
jgi:NAD(P)-dependent dehydrogenase (short-subunit alcohol dehydrogenase family)